MISSSASTSSDLFRESVEELQPAAEESPVARRAESISPPGTGEWIDITA
jgi:hypothetical protein